MNNFRTHYAGEVLDKDIDSEVIISGWVKKHRDLGELIFMDIQMPDMDGRQTTQKLRERNYTRPIIACTANAISGEREKCLEAGMDDYIAKPINQELLQEIVDRNVRF